MRTTPGSTLLEQSGSIEEPNSVEAMLALANTLEDLTYELQNVTNWAGTRYASVAMLRIEHQQYGKSASPGVAACLSRNRAMPYALVVESLLPSDRSSFFRAVQVMYSTDELKQDPILAAVGQLQFEVVQAGCLAGWGALVFGAGALLYQDTTLWILRY